MLMRGSFRLGRAASPQAPPSISWPRHYVTARSFAAGDSPIEGFMTAEGSGPAWRFLTVCARRSTSTSCSRSILTNGCSTS